MSVPRTLDSVWSDFLCDEFKKDYFKNIIRHYKNAMQNKEIIFPPQHLIFNAFNLTPPQNVKVVILGQDPYHNSVIIKNQNALCTESLPIEIPQAMGLSFSVPHPLPLPPSLKNIFKELQSNLGIKCSSGDLSPWARRGVLLLNSILTVRKNAPASHRHFGWEAFTDSVIARLSSEFSGLVFLLWGSFAKKKISLIDKSRHCIITAAHPSPLSHGFLDSKVFTKTQEALRRFQKGEIEWRLS